MTIPSRTDARYLQTGVLLLYAILAREVFHFERTHLTTFLCCAWAITLDLTIGRFYFKKVVFPLSSVIIGLSSSLLIYSHSTLIYLAVVTFGVLSKAFITYRGRHIFNPSSFGVVIVLIFAHRYAVGYPVLFSHYIAPSILFISLGLPTVILARQLVVSLSWLVGFLVFAAFRAAILSVPYANAAFLALAPGTLLFTFHMISDPSTVPKSRPFKILFGLTVALIDAILRQFEIPNSIFYALFVTSCFMPWIMDFEKLPLNTQLSGKIKLA